MKKRMLSIVMALTMILSLLPVTALAAEPTSADGTPTASGTCFFANGTPINITATAPSDATEVTLDGFTATGTDAYISWNENGTTKYIGVDASINKAYVFGGADGRTEAVSVESTSITMTGGTIWRLFGGNYGEEGSTTDYCSVVTGDVNISLSGDAVVKDLLHGAGARNTCVNDTITMEFDGVDLSDSSNMLYVNGGSWGNGNEGTRNIADGTMNTEAVANKVIIKAEDSKFYLLGGGGSGSTKVRSSSVTLNNCELSNLYLGGINGEVVESSIVATDCTIKYLSATNRGFVGTANVDLNNCKITEKLNFGAANGCFETDSGKPDGSGITGSSVWNIDAKTTVAAAALTPLAMRDANDVVTATFDNLTIEKEGEPLPVSVNTFNPRNSVTVNGFLVPETSTLTLKNVQTTVEAGQTLTNVGTIDMDEASKLSVASSATFEQVGTVNGGNVVNDGGTINDDYVARIGTTGYNTLQEAVDAVTTTEPTTITLLKDTSGNGVVVPSGRNITFDLNNCTYTIDGTTVGSPSTETNGFQLLKDSTVTFKNGTITSDKAKILIQNYSNLTLDNVTLNGTNLKGSAPYTLSNNFGNTRIKDTTILAATNGYAFDLYYWPENGYGDGVSVTVEGDSQIKGNVQYGSDDSDTQNVAQKATLNITGGTFTGRFSTYGLNASQETGINISGGTFAQDLSESGYLADAVQYEVGHTGGTFTYAETLEDAQSAAKPGDTITDLKATTTYTLTLDYNDGGATEDAKYNVETGTEVPLPTPTRSGYNFKGWSDGTTTYDAGYKYTVTANATLTAQWSYISTGGGGGGVSSYAITVEESENGAVTADKKSAAEDAEITLTVKPNEGYVLESLTVTDKDGKEIALTDKGEGVYTFAMPASKVTVKATFAEAPVSSELPFTDVDVDDWFYGAVEYVYNNKLMDGTSSTAFSPLMTTTRSMIVTILWRLEGQPQVNYAMTFEDVAGDTWYTEAVRWAASEGIVKGYSDTVFAPDDIVSREQLATILDRYAQYKEYDVTAKGDLTTFVDGDTVSSWAADGMTWAVGAELITGKDGGKLDPTGTATRAEVATMLMRFCENVAK